MKIASVADVKAHFSAYMKETEAGPVVITRNGRPAAILLNVVEEDELEGLLLAYSPKFRAILQAARSEIKQTGGIPHDEFWQQVDAEYADTTKHKPTTAPQVNEKAPRKRTPRKKRVDLV
mgnify:CR=1 FL=1